VCRSELDRREIWSVAVRATSVQGTLRPEADVGFAACGRGHRVVVRRAATAPAAVVPPAA
jgi:hypothetical protein